jgi:hypothetical protein
MRHRWTAREIRFLEKNVEGRTYPELADLFNRRFGLPVTDNAVMNACRRNGLSNGRPQGTPPGLTPWNKGKKVPAIRGARHPCWKPLGSERIDSTFVRVKVKNRGRGAWKSKHSRIWEEANGRKVPRGHVVIFADGNKRNFDLDNLILVSRSELSVMNHLGLISPQGDLTRIGKSIADIKLLIGKRQRKAIKRRK